MTTREKIGDLGPATERLARRQLEAKSAESEEYARSIAIYETYAQRFHATYERLATSYAYKTREASAKPWAEVPVNNRDLMIAVVREVVGPLLKDVEAAMEALGNGADDALWEPGLTAVQALIKDRESLLLDMLQFAKHKDWLTLRQDLKKARAQVAELTKSLTLARMETEETKQHFHALLRQRKNADAK